MSFLTNLWDRVIDRLGAIAAYIPAIAQLLKVSIKEEDAAKVLAHAVELKEAAVALGNAADVIILAVEDGTISLAEGSEIALALEEAIDQFEDVIKGSDEDDQV